MKLCVCVTECVYELVTLQTGTYRFPVLTGKGSAPSWMTKPSIRWVRMWDLTRAWAGLLSTLCWLLFPFPEVMTGAQAAPHLSTQAAWQTHEMLATCTWETVPNSYSSNSNYSNVVVVGYFD